MDSLTRFNNLSIQTLTRRRVAKLIIGKASVALAVIQSCMAFPNLERSLQYYAAGRAPMSWVDPAVVVAELCRIGLHVGLLRVLDGFVPTGRFRSLHHLAMFFESAFQCFVPRPLRPWLAYAPLTNDAIASVLSNITHREIVATVVSQAASSVAQAIPVGCLKAWQGRLPYNLPTTALQIAVDVAMSMATNYVSFRFMKLTGFKNAWALVISFSGSYYTTAAVIGWLLGLANRPISAFIDRLNGLGEYEATRPLADKAHHLSYLKGYCSLERGTLYLTCHEIITGPYDNVMRLHAAKLTADLMAFQTGLRTGTLTLKRKHPLDAATYVFDPPSSATADTAYHCACGCGVAQKRGDTICTFACHHAILKDCEDTYVLDICKYCGESVILVPVAEQEAMLAKLTAFQDSLFERWSSTVLLPDHLFYAPWSEVVAFCKRHKLAMTYALSMTGGNGVPPSRSMLDWALDAAMYALDVGPAEWMPCIRSQNVV